MKQTNLSIFLFAGALGILAITTTTKAADNAMPSCCMAGMATPITDVSTNAMPDLLKTCPVSGEKLGEMGKPVVFIYKGQEVKLCCSNCKKDFDKDPNKFIVKIRIADKK